MLDSCQIHLITPQLFIRCWFFLGSILMGTWISKKVNWVNCLTWLLKSDLTCSILVLCPLKWWNAASIIPSVRKMDCGIRCRRPRTPNTAIRRAVKRSTGSPFYPEYVIIPVIISRWRCRMCYPCTERPDDRQAKHRATQNRDTATYLGPAKRITAIPFNFKCGPECTKKCVS
jgi:hypothetical protein